MQITKWYYVLKNQSYDTHSWISAKPPNIWYSEASITLLRPPPKPSWGVWWDVSWAAGSRNCPAPHYYSPISASPAILDWLLGGSWKEGTSTSNSTQTTHGGGIRCLHRNCSQGGKRWVGRTLGCWQQSRHTEATSSVPTICQYACASHTHMLDLPRPGNQGSLETWLWPCVSY